MKVDASERLGMRTVHVLLRTTSPIAGVQQTVTLSLSERVALTGFTHSTPSSGLHLHSNESGRRQDCPACGP